MPLPIKQKSTPNAGVPRAPQTPLDPHNALVAQLAHVAALEAQDKAAPEWANSQFAPLRNLRSVPKSRAVRDVAGHWLTSIGIPATPYDASGNTALLLPEERVVAVKCSTRWREGSYHFQHLRDWGFQAALLLGISPQEMHAWLVPRDELLAHAVMQRGHHARMLIFHAERVPGWLRRYGGTLPEAAAILTKSLPVGSRGEIWLQPRLLPEEQLRLAIEGLPARIEGTTVLSSPPRHPLFVPPYNGTAQSLDLDR